MDREEDNFDSDFEREIDEYTEQSMSSLLVERIGDVPMVGSSGTKTGDVPMVGSSGTKIGDVMVGSSGTKVLDNFIAMGFPEKMVAEVILEVGEEDADLITQTLLTYSAIEKDAQVNKPNVDSDDLSSEYGGSFLDDFSDLDGLESEVNVKIECDEGGDMVSSLVSMGYTVAEVANAVERCGPGATAAELTDHIWAAQMANAADCLIPEEEEKPRLHSDDGLLGKRKQRMFWEEVNVKIERDDGDDIVSSLVSMGYTVAEVATAVERCGPGATAAELTDHICAAQMANVADCLILEEEKKPRLHSDSGLLGKRKQGLFWEEDHGRLRIPRPMIGFGTPTYSYTRNDRRLPKSAIGPPYFYYGNVALAPKGMWQMISRRLYEVEPEFVDSQFFCAAARERGYVHNLPIRGRFPLLPLPAQTIHEALPLTTSNWPKWDTREKLNCLQTMYGGAKVTEKIRKALENYDDNSPPPLKVQQYVLEECKTWNLVWVGKNKVALLEADEVEMLMGFPRNHTRGGGICLTDRYKSLSNSFQVDTVAYHLSVLKEKFPDGLNLLSLFSGIGGAEVALHRLGIPLKNVVSVEISEVNRGILKCWWEQTEQKGKLIEIADVQKVTAEKLEELMSLVGGFDLVVGGGSPCNLAGSNRHHRDGLAGEQSPLFYDYCRILDVVKHLYGRFRT